LLINRQAEADCLRKEVVQLKKSVQATEQMAADLETVLDLQTNQINDWKTTSRQTIEIMVVYLHNLYAMQGGLCNSLQSLSQEYNTVASAYDHLSAQCRNLSQQLHHVLRNQASEKVDAYYKQWNGDQTNALLVSGEKSIRKERVWWKIWTWFM